MGVQRSTWDVLHSLNALKSNSIGCTEIHGENCFHTVKQQISLKTLQFEILGEIKKLVKEQRGVRDATLLRKMLVRFLHLLKLIYSMMLGKHIYRYYNVSQTLTICVV